MALTLACRHAGQVSAVASVAGAMDADTSCAPARPVAVLQVHGDDDDTIRYGGGDIDGASYTAASQTVARWRGLGGCAGEARVGARQDADATVSGSDLTPSEWTGCRADTAVALWTIAGGSHTPAFTSGFTAPLLDWLDDHRRRP